MPTGPRGEKRPASSVSSMMKAMRIATGIEPKEYTEDNQEQNEESDEDSDEKYELAALEVARPKKQKKAKRD